MKYFFALVALSSLIAGCATPVTSYMPTAGQSVVYDQGVGYVAAHTAGATISIYPTFRYQSPSDLPTFTLMIQNTTDHDIDFDPETMTATLDARPCHLYSADERIAEIRRTARRKQIALAIVGGLAAGAAGYAASHQTASYTSVGYYGNRSFYSSGTIQTYDPASGIFAGAAVGAGTAVGVHQIGKAAGYEEQAAQGIFQHTTVHPGATVVGQVQFKVPSTHFTVVSLQVPVENAGGSFAFERKDTL